jgi:hypothetical protein
MATANDEDKDLFPASNLKDLLINDENKNIYNINAENNFICIQEKINIKKCILHDLEIILEIDIRQHLHNIIKEMINDIIEDRLYDSPCINIEEPIRTIFQKIYYFYPNIIINSLFYKKYFKMTVEKDYPENTLQYFISPLELKNDCYQSIIRYCEQDIQRRNI